MASTTMPASRRKSMFSSCCFADIDNENDINKRASLAHPDRMSRVVMVPTESQLFGEVECIIIEPMAKVLSPEEFVTTGVVVCMQGLLPPSKDTIREWGVANDVAGWTNMGASVVIPNVQANSALDRHDITDVVNGICDFVCFDRVLLVGKDLVGPRLLEAACEEKFDRIVAGIMLLGPTAPPRLSGDLPCPLFLLWAQDDDVSPFMDHTHWVDMAQGSPVALATSKWCLSGGHDFGLVAAQDGVADMLKNFFVSSLLASDLLDSDAAHYDSQKAQARIEQLTQQLPTALRESMVQEPMGGSADLTKKQRMSVSVAQWIAAGMRDANVSQATE